MLTTPEQRAEWARLDKEPFTPEWVAKARSAVPSLLADVAELLEKFAGEEKVSDELGEMAGKYQRDWETAQAQVERLTALLREAKQPHYYCEDPWYSCPKATDGCADESKGTECNCGADQFNARIEKELHD